MVKNNDIKTHYFLITAFNYMLNIHYLKQKISDTQHHT
jgi:hypothetical protein